jgi:protein phosphatase
MTAAPPDQLERQPADEELDVWGLTHAGRVRTENQDHFLLAYIRKRFDVFATSLSDVGTISLPEARLAAVGMVADGVGSGEGERASRIALEEAVLYLQHSLRCFWAGEAHDGSFMAHLESAALRGHAEVRKLREADPKGPVLATTLTLWFGLWPSAYVLQVGDSRCYLFRDGRLRQVTRDQTVAQELFDAGALTRTEAHRSPYANVLSSAIGGPEATPVVTRIQVRWGDACLVCSDGLTKEVPDDRIAERLRTMTSARQACEALLQDALDAGGSDNITILVGRTVHGEGKAAGAVPGC